MGTRHIICIFWKGKFLVAQYGQWDGYPEGQGVKIFRFLSVQRNIDHLKDGLEKRVYYPTIEQLRTMQAEVDNWEHNFFQNGGIAFGNERNGWLVLYPSLARDTGAQILRLIAHASMVKEDEETREEKDDKSTEVEKSDEKNGDSSSAVGSKETRIPIQLQLGFVNDGLFCEWAYVIDLDNEVFEVFGGTVDKDDHHRFKDVGDERDSVPGLVCSLKFSELQLMKSQEEFLGKVKDVLEGTLESD
ncbi:hypothetical protein B0T25DRAFT_587031 [Lasiosphaeria hispida]|uniref:Uncharacterized protein n=1 Tax=Lasiosphaeria hispida TaxID=260671 RepID=A0AAJ0HUK5_9PEZI|nr:hypothetical protein B0T25DRAFT_587031 [Lasiosphaeria hispida]